MSYHWMRKVKVKETPERKATVHVPQLKVWYPVLGENNNTIEIVKIEDSKD